MARFRAATANGALAARVAASAPMRLIRQSAATTSSRSPIRGISAGIDRLGGQKQLLCHRDAEPGHIASDVARIIDDAESGAPRLEPIDHALEHVSLLVRHALPREAIGESTDVEARADTLSRAGQHQGADRRVHIDAIKGLAQDREIGRLEPVALARAVDAHERTAVRHTDERHGRLATSLGIIGIRNPSVRSPPRVACPRD